MLHSVCWKLSYLYCVPWKMTASNKPAFKKSRSGRCWEVSIVTPDHSVLCRTSLFVQVACELLAFHWWFVFLFPSDEGQNCPVAKIRPKLGKSFQFLISCPDWSHGGPTMSFSSCLWKLPFSSLQELWRCWWWWREHCFLCRSSSLPSPSSPTLSLSIEH